MQLWLGLFLGALIGFAAWRLRALTPGGAVAAAILGGVTFGWGGVHWAVLLLAFFITSSGLSYLKRRHKASLKHQYAKGSRRDIAQVVANGGVGFVVVLLEALWPENRLWWLAFAGAMAAANADTWATELGVLSKAAPRLITTGRVVPRGASGGVTLFGYLAALSGAGLIAVLAACLIAGDGAAPGGQVIVFCVTLAGLVGSTVDSILGAAVQAGYYCPACQLETEQYPQHTCGEETTWLRGWRWLDNDRVNLLATLAGACAAVALWSLF